jgi:hypothetical protein
VAVVFIYTAAAAAAPDEDGGYDRRLVYVCNGLSKLKKRRYVIDVEFPFLSFP